MKHFYILGLIGLTLISCVKSEQDNITRNEDFVPICLTKAQAMITADVNSLGFNVLAELLASDMTDIPTNPVISPLSLSSALSICANGADGRTKEQILDVLGIQEGDINNLNEYYSVMLDALYKADRKVDFFSANSLWHDPLINIKEDYRKNVSQTFNAELKAVNFNDKSTVDNINKWCSSKTNGMIPVIIDELATGTSVMIINALYFKGMWQRAFETTQDKVFKHADGSISTEKMIIENRILNYTETDIFKCVEIPYGNGAFVMNLILPVDDLSVENVAKSLANGDWINNSNKLSEHEVKLEFPTFEVKYSHDMSNIMTALGMEDAFTEYADFSNMSDTKLSISSIDQHTAINVTEKGTEASSITNIIMKPESNIGDENVEFIANRPFLYMIRESSTGVILFIGTIS
jgi:serpin B